MCRDASFTNTDGPNQTGLRVGKLDLWSAQPEPLTQCDLTKRLILGRTAHDHTIARAQPATDLRYIRAELPILYLYWSSAGLIGVQAVQQSLRRRQGGSRNINRILNRH